MFIFASASIGVLKCLFLQGYSAQKLQIILRKLYGRHTDRVHKLDISVSNMLVFVYRM